MDIPQFSVGDKVSVSINEDKLAQLVKKQKDFGDVYSMVCCQMCMTALIIPMKIAVLVYVSVNTSSTCSSRKCACVHVHKLVKDLQYSPHVSFLIVAHLT